MLHEAEDETGALNESINSLTLIGFPLHFFTLWSLNLFLLYFETISKKTFVSGETSIIRVLSAGRYVTVGIFLSEKMLCQSTEQDPVPCQYYDECVFRSWLRDNPDPDDEYDCLDDSDEGMGISNPRGQSLSGGGPPPPPQNFCGGGRGL